MKNDRFPIELLRPSIIKIIEREKPTLLQEEFISANDLDEIRKFYYLETLQKADIKNELSIEEIAESLVNRGFVSNNANLKFEEDQKVSDSISYNVASFFGSWTFIIIIFLLIIFWLLFNLFASDTEKFDPFPFAVLGLFLTGLSALQAPFILHSQKLQGEREKIKFDEDYQTNIKAELEIRNLHSKMDFYNKKVWEKLSEIEKKI